MNNLTIPKLLKHKPCGKWDKYVKNVSSDWEGSILDILNMDFVTDTDKVWVATRHGIIEDSLIKLFLGFCVEQAHTNVKYPSDFYINECLRQVDYHRASLNMAWYVALNVSDHLKIRKDQVAKLKELIG